MNPFVPKFLRSTQAGMGGVASATELLAAHVATHSVGAFTNATTAVAKNFGAAHSSRRIVCVIGYRTLEPTAFAVEIGGIPATIHLDADNNFALRFGILVASALVPSGTTGDIVIITGSSMLWLEMDVFRVVGASAFSSSGHQFGTVTPSVTVAAITGGVILAGYVSQKGGRPTAVTWTGATEVSDRQTLANDDTYSSANAIASGDAISTVETSANSSYSQLGAVSFAPA